MASNSDREGRPAGRETGRGGKGSGGLVASLTGLAEQNPAAKRLLAEAEDYLGARFTKSARSLTEKIVEAGHSLEGGGGLGEVAAGMVGGKNPIGALAKGAAAATRSKLRRGGGSTKATHITEQVDVGVPLQTAYNQWTQFGDFATFTKGVQSVEQSSQQESVWKAKIFWSTRSWTAKITEQVPDERIAWTSDGEKGSLNGVVTFHELAPTLTRVILVLEYFPKGIMEKTGNVWRAQGRRARLDLKNFARFVMLRNEETGAWRGEIHDGEVAAEETGERSPTRRRSASGESTGSSSGGAPKARRAGSVGRSRAERTPQ